MTKVGPKEAQRRALRDLQWAPGTPYKAGDTVIRAGKSYVVSATIPKPARRASQKAASELKRIGRPPRLSKGDYAAVDAASRDLLATALKHYLKHAARNKLRNRG